MPQLLYPMISSLPKISLMFRYGLTPIQARTFREDCLIERLGIYDWIRDCLLQSANPSFLLRRAECSDALLLSLTEDILSASGSLHCFQLLTLFFAYSLYVVLHVVQIRNAMFIYGEHYGTILQYGFGAETIIAAFRGERAC